MVLKVGTELARIGREVEVALHARRAEGPVLEPLAGPIQSGRFAVSAWPYRAADPRPVDDEAAATALAALHLSLAETPVHLPTLGERFKEVRGLLDDHVATGALAPAGRALLRMAVDEGAAESDNSVAAVLHAEPHDANRLTVEGKVVYLDLESVCTGPLEWDLAYFPEGVAEHVWPSHDPQLRRRLRVGVSACVSTYCWRHVTSRPADTDMRWHAEHHLKTVRDLLKPW